MTATNANFDQAELDKFGDLAHRWWGEATCLRVSSGRSRVAERPATDGRAGVHHHGWFGVTIEIAQ
ncbi:MAG: hypothetical protein ABIT64_04170 [Lysobacteraceae bacterium]